MWATVPHTMGTKSISKRRGCPPVALIDRSLSFLPNLRIVSFRPVLLLSALPTLLAQCERTSGAHSALLRLSPCLDQNEPRLSPTRVCGRIGGWRHPLSRRWASHRLVSRHPSLLWPALGMVQPRCVDLGRERDCRTLCCLARRLQSNLTACRRLEPSYLISEIWPWQQGLLQHRPC